MWRLCAVILLASPALAADTAAEQQARALVRNAKSAFDAGQFDQAAGLLEQAMALAPTPATLYNLARAREKSERLEAAVDAYRAYLREAPDTKDRGAVEATIDELTRRIDEKKRLEALEKQGPRVIEVPVETQSHVRVSDVAPWVVVAVGLAGVLAGVALGTAAQGSSASAMADLNTDVGLAVVDQQRALGQALGANVSYVAGGVALVAGLLWWVLAHVGAN